MYLLAYTLLGGILALLGAVVWRFELTTRLSGRPKQTVPNPRKLARFAGLFLTGLGVYAVLCGYLAQQATTPGGQVSVMILFVLGAQLAMAGYAYGLRRFTQSGKPEETLPTESNRDDFTDPDEIPGRM